MEAKLFGILIFALLLAPLAHAVTTNANLAAHAHAIPPRPTASTSMYTNDQPPAGQNALRKLGRGFSNLLFGIVEVPNQFTKATDANGGAAVPYGIGKGIFRWFQREFVGVYEIITFPFPAPKGYQPIMTPEWPNEDYESS